MAVRRLAEVQPDHFDFTPENRAWVDRQIRKYPPGREASAVMALLRRAQAQHDGWLPKPAIEKVAEILGMPDIRVLEIATFYSMYNLAPVGRFFVQFCGTTPCVLRGADAIKAVLEQRIGPQGHISADGMFSWLEVECLGACCNAPMVQINDDYYEDLTPENFTALLDDLAAGRPARKGSQIGRKSSEPVGGLTSLTTFYGVDGRENRFLQPGEGDSAPDPAAAASEKASQDEAATDLGPGGLQGRPDQSTARPVGPAEGTGTRTDDPVGANQLESGALDRTSPEAARDRQEQPSTGATPKPKKARAARKPTDPKSGEG